MLLPKTVRLGLLFFVGLGLLAPTQAEELAALLQAAQTRGGRIAPALNRLLDYPIEDRLAPRRRLATVMRRDLATQSRAARAALVRAHKRGEVPRFDVVVVGGGVHAAVFTATLSATRPDASILVVEAGKTLGRVFDQAGEMFRINSPESEDASTNEIPGSPVRLRALTSAKFANAEILGDLVLMTHYTSKAMTVTEERVVKISQPNDVMQVELSSGARVAAQSVVLATGLGSPRLPFKDEATRQLIKRDVRQRVPLSEAPGIQVFDSAIRRANATREQGLDSLEAYQDQRVAVVGSGDGANVFVEFLLGQAPAAAYISPPQVRSRVLWAGQRASDFESFAAANKPRYHTTFEKLFSSDRIDPVPEHVATIQPSAEGGYRIGFQSGREEVADKVVLCTGYVNLAAAIAAGVGPGLQFEPVEGQLASDGLTTHVARQAETQGSRRRVFLIGAGAAPLATPEELAQTRTKNAVSINVLAPRTAAFAQVLAAELSRSAPLAASE